MPWYQNGPEHQWPAGKPPTHVTAIGMPTHEPVDIYLGSVAMDALHRAVADDPFQTRWGLLLGQAQKDGDRPLITVNQCIFFRSQPQFNDEDDASAVKDGLSIRPEDIETLRGPWQGQNDVIVVGWFHCGPRRALSLTAEERTVLQTHFPKPWHIALFIDSQEETSRLYVQIDGPIVSCDGFYYWDMSSEHKPPLRKQVVDMTFTDAEKPPTPRKRFGWRWIAACLLLYGLIPFSPGSIGWVDRSLAMQADGLASLVQQLKSLEEESRLLQAQIAVTERQRMKIDASEQQPAPSDRPRGPKLRCHPPNRPDPPKKTICRRRLSPPVSKAWPLRKKRRSIEPDWKTIRSRPVRLLFSNISSNPVIRCGGSAKR